LRRAGVIDPVQERFAQEARRPIAEHLADFHAALVARGRSPKHIAMTDSRVRYVVRECHAERLDQLTASTVQQVIRGIRDASRSLETCNSYIRAAKGFTRWLWRDGRLPSDPLTAIESHNTAGDQRHARRDLSAEELSYLLAFVAQHTRHAHRLAGPDRAMLYRVAVGTGFRVGELRSLTPASFDLDSDPPTIAVEAAYSKRRRRDVQPIRLDLADALRIWLAGRAADERVFGVLPRVLARTLRTDLAAARAA
jgi:integrase